MPIWVVIVVPIVLVILGAFIGYKIAMSKFKKSIKDKPFMNRRQIKAIFKIMGLQVSERDINMMEQSFKKAGEGVK